MPSPTPTQSAAALVRAYRDAPQYVDLTEHLETMLPQTLAALLELVEAQRDAMLELRTCIEDGCPTSKWLADTIRWDAAGAKFDAAIALTETTDEA